MSALPSRKQELLALLLEKQGIKPLPTISAKRDGVAAPLSFAQQRLWFLQQLDPDNPTYNIPQVVRLRGELNVDALSRSLSEVIRRHEILRTTFATVAGDPVQVVNQPFALSLTEIDLRSFSPADRGAEVRRLSLEEAAKPFDLTHGPLLRARLLRTADREHVALFTTHHIVSDEWSQGILIRELSVLYEAFVNEQPSLLPELTTQYSDFARWQREWLQGEELAAQLGYWQEQLRGDLPVLQLPLDHPRPAVQTFRGATAGRNLSENIIGPLRTIARQEDATLFIALLAAFKLLLHRYTGENDILVGTPIAGRNRAEIESLIGFFVNTLVLRTELAGDPSYREVLRRVRQTALAGYAHQDLPFEVLVRELRPERSLSHTPLFQVAFMLRNASREVASLSGIEMTALGSGAEVAKFDLTMIVEDFGAGLNLLVSYNSDLFEPATIENLLDHLGQLLKGIAAQPDVPNSALSLLTDEERHRLLVEWNDTRTVFPEDVSVLQLFEAQVARTPNATALLAGDERLTFSELNRRANQLAWHLKDLGVGPEVPVGLCVERSAELVVGLLAIWKAGGAFVPLDPQYPASRLAFIVADTAMPVLITEQALADIIPPHDAELVCWDTDRELIEENPENNLESESRPEQLAYVIYTSGSTGQPKGVLIEHQQLTNTLLGSHAAFDFDATDVMPCIASSSFDIFLFELLNPLLAGGCSLLMASREVMEIPVIVSMLDQITSLHAVPGLMRQLLRAGGDTGGRNHVRQVFVGGDSVSPDLLNDLERAFPAAQIHVLYGPTEAAMICAQYSHLPSQRVSHQMIGKPLSNVVLRINDPNGNIVPTGVAGELYIGGAGVARGYLNRNELTAEKFVEIDGKRFYRSGDLARYLPDGNIVFMGRIDAQVKVRGFRVELGEVQRALRALEGVRDAVVIARADDAGDKALFAYIVADGPSLLLSALRHELKEQLPEYMIPAAFVLLDEIPLTANGKLDLKALPKVDRTSLQLDETYSAPRTPTEEVVAGIWANVLGLSQVGATDNFFELGGHSLLAAKAVAQIKQAFKLDVPLRALFESPTVREFSAVVEERQRADYHLEEMPIGRISRDGNLPLSFAQQRLWFHDQLSPGNAAYNVFAAVRLTGTLSVPALERALEEIIRRHESLRTTFSTVSFEPVQIIAPSLPLPLKKIDLSALPREERETEARRLATAEIRAPFDLAHGPLLRVVLIALDEQEHLLALTMHHIISDGWSMGVLIGEFGKLYEALVADRPSPLSELPLQYADYAYWHREWLQGEVLETQLAYWRERLGNINETPLPLDRPRPAQQSFRGAYQNFVLSKELSDKLKALSRREDVTTFMLALGGFKALLHSYSGATDIVVGTDVASRNRIETEGLIGFFANQLVLRTDLSGDPSFSEILARVREVALGAYAHQDLPFDKVVEALKPELDLSRNPLFQAMFGFKNAPMSGLELPELSLTSFPLHDETAVFDLSFYLTDAAQGLTCLVRFNTDIFDAATITRMWQRYETLLSYAVDDPSRKLSELRTHVEESTERELTQRRNQLLKNARRRSVGT